MRRFRSIILKIVGLALGLGVVGLLIGSDNMRLGRHVLDVVWLDLLIGFAIGFPFLWLADKLSPDGSDASADTATSE
jgi:hypothetical protein